MFGKLVGYICENDSFHSPPRRCFSFSGNETWYAAKLILSQATQTVVSASHLNPHPLSQSSVIGCNPIHLSLVGWSLSIDRIAMSIANYAGGRQEGRGGYANSHPYAVGRKQTNRILHRLTSLHPYLWYPMVKDPVEELDLNKIRVLVMLRNHVCLKVHSDKRYTHTNRKAPSERPVQVTPSLFLRSCTCACNMLVDNSV